MVPSYSLSCFEREHKNPGKVLLSASPIPFRSSALTSCVLFSCWTCAHNSATFHHWCHFFHPRCVSDADSAHVGGICSLFFSLKAMLYEFPQLQCPRVFICERMLISCILSLYSFYYWIRIYFNSLFCWICYRGDPRLLSFRVLWGDSPEILEFSHSPKAYSGQAWSRKIIIPNWERRPSPRSWS